MRRLAKWQILVIFLLAAVLSPRVASARTSGAGYAAAKSPIVLVPGVLGFKRLFGVVEYFYNIPRTLEEGGAKVYVVELDALNSVEARGEDLLRQLRLISAVSGAPRLNVIAHSQGGIDSRYAMAVRPDLFASLTTISSPHHGAPIADFIADHTSSGGILHNVGGAIANGLGFLVNLFGGDVRPQDALATLRDMESGTMSDFNARYPAGIPQAPCGEGAAEWNGTRLYSWGGGSAFTNPLDPADYAFKVASFVTNLETDGIIDRCSSHFGTLVGDGFTMNHGDEVNQVVGLTALFGSNPLELFRTHANRLVGEGL